ASDDDVAALGRGARQALAVCPHGPYRLSVVCSFARSPLHDRRRRVRPWCGAEGCGMIRRFVSDLESFKTLTFKPGLNILLADKSAGATDRQSRNGAGKTSFVELVHFLFGADARKESIFRSDELTEWTFDVAVDVAGGTISVARCGA